MRSEINSHSSEVKAADSPKIADIGRHDNFETKKDGNSCELSNLKNEVGSQVIDVLDKNGEYIKDITAFSIPETSVSDNNEKTNPLKNILNSMGEKVDNFKLIVKTVDGKLLAQDFKDKGDLYKALQLAIGGAGIIGASLVIGAANLAVKNEAASVIAFKGAALGAAGGAAGALGGMVVGAVKSHETNNGTEILKAMAKYGAAGFVGGVIVGEAAGCISEAIKQAPRMKYDRMTRGEPLGGRYKDIKIGGQGDRYEVHHMPPDCINGLLRDDGPSIKMDKLDHRLTMSCGNSNSAREYRALQKGLIDQGKFREAFNMDVQDIHSKFGTKYDTALNQALDYLSGMEKAGMI